MACLSEESGYFIPDFMPEFPRLFARIFLGVFFVTLGLANAPLSSAEYAFTTETILEGGYDYSETESHWVYDPEVSLNEYLEITYREVEGASILNFDLVLDENEFAHAVVNVGGVGLQYITNESGTWVYETIWPDTATDLNSYVGIKMDSNGTFHVVYESANDGLLYLYNSTGTWRDWTVATIAGSYDSVDFGLDTLNDIHIVYLNATGDLTYATFQNFANRTAASKTLLNATRTILESRDSSGYQTFGEVRLALNGKNPYVVFERIYGTLGIDYYLKKPVGTWSTVKNIVTGSENLLDIQFDQSQELHVWTGKVSHLYEYLLSSGTWTSTDTSVSSYDYYNADFMFNPLHDGIVVGSWCYNTTCEVFEQQTGVSGRSIVDYVTGVQSENETALALTKRGVPHLLYTDAAEPEYLKYAASTEVREEAAASVAGEVMYPSIVTDSSRNPYIAYYNYYTSGGRPTGDLMLASDTGAGWSTLAIDTTGDTGLHPDLAIDENDALYISYYYASDGTYSQDNLMFASNCNGTWVTDTVDGVGTGSHSVGEYSAIAVDSTGQVHIVYYDDTDDSLRYATSLNTCGSSMSWTTEAIDETVGADVGQEVSMVMDETGVLYFSYYDATNSNLKYGYGTSGAWTTTTLDSTDANGHYSSIGLDSTKKVHISYYSSTDSSLRYITNKTSGLPPFIMGIKIGWIPKTVDDSASVGLYTSLVMNSEDTPFISYYDGSNQDLKFAFLDGSTWDLSILDGAYTSTGLWSTLAVDNLDFFHIGYVDSGDDLQYLKF